MATILDVAERAGVSASTVSRVLNGTGNVQMQLREKVLAAVTELGYVPSSSARVLRGKPSNTIALIVSDVTNPFFAALARGVEDVAQQQGFSLVLCNADRGPAKQRRYLDRLVADGVKGMVVAPAKNTLMDLKRRVRQGVSMVVVDWRYPLQEADNVYTDSVDGARQLVAHLIGLGHRRIGIISGPHGDMTAEDRVAGYRLALAEAGLSVAPQLVRFGQFTSESGRRNCTKLLSLNPPPTAIVTCNNRLAAGAYEALCSRGLVVPLDLSLVSFDDIPFVAALASSATVFVQPDYEMGHKAAELLFERLLNQRRTHDRREVVLQGRLIVRSSAQRLQS